MTEDGDSLKAEIFPIEHKDDKMHKRTPLCGKRMFLCANPAHWVWDYFTDNRKWNKYAPLDPDDDSKSELVEQAMTGDLLAYKALGCLAWSRKDWEEWRPLVLKLYQSLVKNR